MPYQATKACPWKLNSARPARRARSGHQHDRAPFARPWTGVPRAMPATLSASGRAGEPKRRSAGQADRWPRPTYAAWSKGRLHVTLTMAAYDLIHLLQLLGAAAGSATRRPPAIAAAIPAHTTSIDPASHQDRLAKPCEYPWPAWDNHKIPARRNGSMASRHRPVIPAPKRGRTGGRF